MFKQLFKTLYRKQVDFDKLNWFQLSLTYYVEAGNIIKVV